MTEERKGQIAIAILKLNFLENGRITNLSDSSDVRKRLGDAAPKMQGISKEELLEFVQLIGAEILTEANEKLQKISFKTVKVL